MWSWSSLLLTLTLLTSSSISWSLLGPSGGDCHKLTRREPTMKVNSCQSFSATTTIPTQTSRLSSSLGGMEGTNISSCSRRNALSNIFSPTLASVLFVATSTTTFNQAWAADEGKATIYRTGKAPIVPGQPPKDKGDLKGTKKDPNFLRSVADCRSQCQNTVGSDGLAKPKEDCLSECQDICCTTYEQCTFAITPRL